VLQKRLVLKRELEVEGKWVGSMEVRKDEVGVPGGSPAHEQILFV